jgi:lipoprotein-anchoring transpeptidase ErfK/SrfK
MTKLFVNLGLASVCFLGAVGFAFPTQVRADPYGGGLLEFLLTGHDGSAARASRPAVRTDARAASHPHQMVATIYNGVPGAARDTAASRELHRPVNPIYDRQEVAYSGGQKPGTIVIDTKRKFLFLVEKDGKALRYGIGVGRPGFTWVGVKTITRKAEWPGWTPPPDMLKRRPDLPRHMAGGIGNPLGARALYLGSSMYRIHGTNDPSTIGTNVSSGCIRLTNKDVEDLYNRVGVGTKVIVM